MGPISWTAGRPFYSVYETADGHVAVGALEPRFYASLLDGLDIPAGSLPDRSDRRVWPRIRAALASRFLERTRDEWADRLAGMDACVAPVLSALEAPAHRHNESRGVFVEIEGVTQPAPAQVLLHSDHDPVGSFVSGQGQGAIAGVPRL